MGPTNKIDTADAPISTNARSIPQSDEGMVDETVHERMKFVFSRREWIRTGVRTVVLLGLGGMMCLLLRRTGQGKPCFRAGCRNCPQLSSCQIRPANMIRLVGPVPPRGESER